MEGQAPLKATVYDLQTFRCNLCGEIFAAKPPEGVGDEKYDASAGVCTFPGTGFPRRGFLAGAVSKAIAVDSGV